MIARILCDVLGHKRPTTNLEPSWLCLRPGCNVRVWPKRERTRVGY
jgi:hypothetical protein